jgi:dipeptidase
MIIFIYFSQNKRERTISLYRTSDSYLVQSRSWLPDAVGGVLWFGSGAAHGTTYVPVLAGMLAAPAALSYGWQGVYNLSTTFWAYRSVINLAQIKYSYISNDLKSVQHNLETNLIGAVDQVTEVYSKLVSEEEKKKVMQDITEALTNNADVVVAVYRNLFHQLMFKYADGNLNYWNENGFAYNTPGIYYLRILRNIQYVLFVFIYYFG